MVRTAAAAIAVLTTIACATAQPAGPPGWGGAALDAGDPLTVEQASFERAGYGPGCPQAAREGWFGGVSFLLVRPHFSEAIAFAQGTQTSTTFGVSERELQFDYDATVRATAGFRMGDGEARFTYTRLAGDVSVSGGVGGPGEFIVDPFGNVVGAVAIIDPSDARFGTVITGGDAIATRAEVDLHNFEFEFARSIAGSTDAWDVTWSVGVRLADLHQYYGSVVTDSGGAPLAAGDFTVDFIGAGPQAGLASRWRFGRGQRWTLRAESTAALVVGEYDSRFGNTSVSPTFAASQRETLTRTLPVLEFELGASRLVGDHLELSAGWLFQTWTDLGTSGGQFAGLFSGADDGNIMSFDGLMLSAEATY